jgi:hypothetical protein
MTSDGKEGAEERGANAAAGAIEKACRILKAMTDPRNARLTDIATYCGMEKSTAMRVLDALIREDMVIRDPVSKRYNLGPEIARIGSCGQERFDWRAIGRASLMRLAGEFEDTGWQLPDPGEFPAIGKQAHAGRRLRRHRAACGDDRRRAGSSPVTDSPPAGELSVHQRGGAGRAHPGCTTRRPRDADRRGGDPYGRGSGGGDGSQWPAGRGAVYCSSFRTGRIEREAVGRCVET